MRLDEARQQKNPRVSTAHTSDSSLGAPQRHIPWRGTRASMFSSVRLAIMRLAHGRALLAAVALGMLVAVTLICTVPLFNALIVDTQLQQAINTSDVSAHNVQAYTNSDASETARRVAESHVPQLAQQYLSPFVTSTPTHFVQSDALLLRSAGAQMFDPLKAPQATLEAWDYTRTASHMQFLSGGIPQSGSSPDIQVIVTKEMAGDLNLKVGSQITLWQFGAHQNQVLGRVAGVWQPKSAHDPFWNNVSFSGGGTPTAPKNYPVLVTENDFFNTLGKFAGMGVAQNWIYYTDPSRINSANMASIANNLTLFRAHLSGDLQATSAITGVGVIGQLDKIITALQGQQTLLALPLYVVVAQVVGLALLFVVAMAGLLIEGQSSEIATLKSRGASGAQLLGVFIVQGLILGLISAIAGAFLAALLALTLVRVFIPASTLNSLLVSPSYLAQLATPATVAGPAVIGALLGIGAVVFSALQMARMDVLAFRREQGRQSRKPFWERYYLDLALVVLCAIGYLELGQFGGTSIRAQLPGGASSPLLLLSPALLLLAGALLVLRLAPLAASIGQRVASRGRGLSTMLAFAQVERTPAKYMRMTLLLTLAVGLGIFAISFDASLSQNVRDTASYTIGADLRIRQNFPETPELVDRISTAYEAQPGVKALTPVYRTAATTTPDQGNVSLALLAIDPSSFGSVAGPTSWRSDYAPVPLDQLMAQMRANSTPSSGDGTPIWAVVSQNFAQQYALKVGERFSLQLDESFFGTSSFQVGMIVPDFPTMYPSQYPAGFAIIDINDFIRTVKQNDPNPTQPLGPNEFWLRTDGTAAHEAAFNTYLGNHPDLDARNVFSLRQQLASAEANPVSSGMRGLLLIGAIMAAALAILGAVVQSGLAARQRATQFAVLRTLGVGNRELIQILLSEQTVVYAFGLLGGTALGALLVTATLPFLQFSDRPVDPSFLGTPPYVLVTNPPALAFFYVSLLAAFVVALLIAARYAATVGLGRALRLGED